MSSGVKHRFKMMSDTNLKTALYDSWVIHSEEKHVYQLLVPGRAV